MGNATILEINAKAIKHNLAYFKSKLDQKTKILAVVKAFAYGSDATILATILQKEKIDYLAVAYTDEGIALRKAGIDLPILVLHPQFINFDELIDFNLEPNIYSELVLSKFIKIATLKGLKKYPIHLKFNTGLNRLGFDKNTVESVISTIKLEKSIVIQSIFSHLAASEDLSEKKFTKKQINSFIKIKSQVLQLLDYKPLFHLLNTSGIVNYSTSQFDMVRLGIGLYGFANETKITQKLKNVLSLKSVISQIHYLKKGKSVGYNRAFTTKTNTKIATIAIGHADGISRQLGNKNGCVLINNQKASIIGNVCMDMIMVDITSINCKEGDEVILFNSQKMIEEMAAKMNTISYELITMISQRVKRILI